MTQRRRDAEKDYVGLTSRGILPLPRGSSAEEAETRRSLGASRRALRPPAPEVVPQGYNYTMKPLLALLALAAAPLPAARPAPRLLLTAEDFARIARLAETAPWAASVRNAIIEAAGNWPSAQVSRYELDEWKVPPEGGQWSQWYVCPTHGVRLQFGGPGRNLCPIDSRNFTGRPYDQVVYNWRHSDNAAAARDNGLAYRFTGKLEYAHAAARILEAYAAAYAGYPIHDKDGS